MAFAIAESLDGGPLGVSFATHRGIVTDRTKWM